MTESFSVTVSRWGATLRHRVDGEVVERFFVPGQWAHLDGSLSCAGEMINPVHSVGGLVSVERVRGRCDYCGEPVRLYPSETRRRERG